MIPDITGLAGLFGRNFVVGYLIPSLLFVATCTVGWTHLYGGLLREFLREPAWWALLVLFLFGALIALVLSLFNFGIVRLYEGYEPAPFPWLLGPFFWNERRKYRRMKEAIDGLDDNDYEKYDEVLLFHQRFPSEEHELTATKLGNTIRAFEMYPYNRYRMDAVTLWPRLLAVVPDRQTSAISEAVAEFNFFLNASFLSLLLVFWYFLTHRPRELIEYGIAVLPLVLSYAFYQAACSQASGWGELVKTAFDVYRFDLLKQMRVQVPRTLTLDEERMLWPEIQQSMKFLRDSDPPLRSDLRE